MNNMGKVASVVGVCMESVTATTVIFNGCNNTANDYFSFTSGGGDEYHIGSCIPKSNPVNPTTVTIRVSGSVDGNQVSLGERAFDWSQYGSDYSNLKVNLIFEKTNDKYVQMPQNCAWMFIESDKPNKIAKIGLDLSGINTSNVTVMGFMFYRCTELTSLNLSNFNTSNVVSANSWFNGCSGLASLNLSNLDTSNFDNLGHMFFGCSSLTSLDLSNFTCPRNGGYLDNMFKDCTSLTYLDICNIDARNALNIAGMFQNCVALSTLKISEKFSPPIDPRRGINTMFLNCNPNIKFVGTEVNKLIVASNDVKSRINKDADKVYVLNTSTCIPENLVKIIASHNIKISVVIDSSVLFNTTSSEAIYIGLNRADHIIVVDGDNKIISGALINKTINGTGYYPANLRLTGSITLSGDNSEFNEKLLMVGDGVKDTVVTFTDPKALPETDIIVEKNAKLVFTGNKEYVLPHEITFKAIGLLASANSIICTNGGATIEFEA